MVTATVNLAATAVATDSLGPGRRAVVWVQGCPLNCRGCVAPDWIPLETNRIVTPEALAAQILAMPRIGGLTLSGGEPMLQAAALADVVRRVRAVRDLDVICFSGFTLARLRDNPPTPAVAELLAVIDVLIDGPYVAARDNGRGLRGSDNQAINHLTDRLRGSEYDFADRPRTAELHVDARSVTLVGVPPPGLLTALDAARARHTSHAPRTPLALESAGPEIVSEVLG
ncbi:4Fe-4S single cluster domain-containing protein [Nocardia alba]|uniref:Anaerobic ribonucleoside-triphosphate reductase activating protein n=1 Tax=Nocardia alba TaxID=225051 RepID=A0A4R1FV41_9NOCA|nr:4Fe-4S single cluster domain-containing protein [Nocardia alba]TCJ97714.1 anaerobic ribonucleoside-triphosphate reductase activating protein [Nocardia alba]